MSRFICKVCRKDILIEVYPTGGYGAVNKCFVCKREKRDCAEMPEGAKMPPALVLLLGQREFLCKAANELYEAGHQYGGDGFDAAILRPSRGSAQLWYRQRQERG